MPVHLETQEGHFSKTNLLIPIGAGLAFDVSEKLSLGLEFSSRFPVSDYLDGISESANPDRKDWYSTGGVTLACLLYTSPSPRDATLSRMPSSA